MDISWDDVALFSAVAEAGSLSEAARRLRVGQATVSRRVAGLEASLGRPLFQRTPDGVELTPLGHRLLPLARSMSASATELGRLASEDDPSPSGVVRIAAPPGIAADFLVPFAAELRDAHPELRLVVLSGIRKLDLLRGEADLALRTEAPSEPQLAKVATLAVVVRPFVSPGYAATLPARPALADVAWLTLAPPWDLVPPGPQLAEAIPDFRPAFTSDDFLVLWRAAQLGVGALCLGGARHRYRSEGALVPLDLELGVTGRVHLVAPKAQLGAPRIARVLERLLDALSDVEEAELEIFEPA